MIRIDGLAKYFKDGNNRVIALDNINLEIGKGDIFGIIGLSGAGKSTLIRCINRLEEPSKGAVYIDNEDITKFDEQKLIKLRRRIGMIFQQFNLLSRKTCADNIAFPLKICKCDNSSIEKRVDELLELVDLKDKKNCYPSQLSGGQKQRVAIARALATGTDILLCDEATSALDPTTTKSILKLLKDINDRIGITIVMITHQMEVIKEICNKVAVISEGSIVECGNTYEIITDPKHEVTKNFFSHTSFEAGEYDWIRKENSKLIQITFLDDKVHEPVISHLVRSFDIEANIIGGQINKVQNKSYGKLLIDLTGDEKSIKAALDYLKKEKLYLEESN